MKTTFKLSSFNYLGIFTVALIVSIIFHILIEAPAATAWSLSLKWLTTPKRSDVTPTQSRKAENQATDKNEIDKTDNKTEEL